MGLPSPPGRGLSLGSGFGIWTSGWSENTVLSGLGSSTSHLRYFDHELNFKTLLMLNIRGELLTTLLPKVALASVHLKFNLLAVATSGNPTPSCQHIPLQISGEYSSTSGAFLIDLERLMALLPMEELLLARPDLNKVMALMPNMEDLEELLIKRLDCGGRGTVGVWKSTFFLFANPGAGPSRVHRGEQNSHCSWKYC